MLQAEMWGKRSRSSEREAFRQIDRWIDKLGKKEKTIRKRNATLSDSDKQLTQRVEEFREGDKGRGHDHE